MHYGPHALVASHHAAHLPTREWALANSSTAHTTHDVALNSKTFAASLGQKNRIHERPNDPVTAKPIDKLSRMIPKQVLHPFLRTHVPLAMVI